MAWGLRHTYGGDPSIYLPFARNAAHGDPFSFNPHQFSSGSTSPLWPLVLAPAYAVGAGAAGAKAIAAAVTIAALALVVLAAWRVSGSLLAAGIGAFALFPTLGLFGSVLYETPLAVALVALSVLAGERVVARATAADAPLDARTLAPLALVWAALPLARPEAAVLVAIQAVVLWRRTGALRPLALTLGLAALPALAYFGVSEASLGVLSTSTEARAAALREGADRLGPLYVTSAGLDFVDSLPFVFAFAPGLVGLWLLARRGAARWVGAYGLAAIAAHLFLVTFVSPSGFETGRYLTPAIAFVAIGLAGALAALRGRRLEPVALVLAAGLVVVPAAIRAEERVSEQRRLPLSLDEVTDAGAARVVDRLARPGDTVLTYEVQVRQRLRDDVDVLSLDGVTDGKVRHYRSPARVGAFLRRHRPRFWIASAPAVLRFRRFLRGSPLDHVATSFAADPRLRERSADGIRFRLLARRRTGVVRLFGGWTALFELRYAASEHASARADSGRASSVTVPWSGFSTASATPIATSTSPAPIR
jgi:hypothetical protein